MEIVNGEGKPYKVFTPYGKACLRAPEPREPLPEPSALTAAKRLDSDDLAAWKLQPTKPKWATTIAETWTPGQDTAAKRLDDFLDGPADFYADERDYPAKPATSTSSRNCASTGASASNGFGTRLSTPMPRVTRSTGSGSPGLALTPPRTSACLTPKRRRSASTRTAVTWRVGRPTVLNLSRW